MEVCREGSTLRVWWGELARRRKDIGGRCCGSVVVEHLGVGILYYEGLVSCAVGESKPGERLA
jgi:hypothetical protein